jgi:carbon monoxide dehydrogenase subunit G
VGTATYSFREQWHVPAPRAQVHAVLADVEGYVAWWPQVVAVADLGGGRGLVLCRSVLPYTLELVLTERRNEPGVLEVQVEGHLEGTVAFALAEDGRGTRVSFRQDVVVRGWLAPASRLARPALVWNHQRMMRGCREGLARRVAG